MKIDIVHPGYLRVSAGDLERAGLGGNETAMVLAARLLAARSHEVRVFADGDPAKDQGAQWVPLLALDEREYRDVVIFWGRTKGSGPFNAPARAVKRGTRKAKDGLLAHVLDGSVNLLIALSDFQRDLYVRDHGFPGSASWVVTPYSLDITQYRQRPAKIPDKFLHAAASHRGLQHVLDMWPAIRARAPRRRAVHRLQPPAARCDTRRGPAPVRHSVRARAIHGRPRCPVPGPRPQTRAHLAPAHRRVLPVPDAGPGNMLRRSTRSGRCGRRDPVLPGGSTHRPGDRQGHRIPHRRKPVRSRRHRKFLDRIGLLLQDAPRREGMVQAARDLAAAHDFSQAVLPVWENAFARILAAGPVSSPQD